MFNKSKKFVKKLFGERILPHIRKGIKDIKAVKKCHEADLETVEGEIKILQNRRRIIKKCIKDYEKFLTIIQKELENE